MSASMYEVFHWAGDSKPLKFSIAGPEINIGEPSASSSSAKRATRCHSMVLGEERVWNDLVVPSVFFFLAFTSLPIDYFVIMILLVLL